MELPVHWQSDLPIERHSASRALTLTAALGRLGIPACAERRLTIHVLGASFREEGSDLIATSAVFAPLFSVLKDKELDKVQMLLVGPTALGPSDKSVAADDETRLPTGLLLETRHRQGLYHEVSFEPRWEPDLVCAFQPGFYGYGSWEPSIRRVLELKAPFLATSYSHEEAEEDQHTLLEEFGCDPMCWEPPGWPPEANAFASPLRRGEQQEQCCWQCLVPPSLRREEGTAKSGGQGENGRTSLVTPCSCAHPTFEST
ncbi:MSS51 [Symbiodinium sp. CCMP2456]|nr:MSS51 [Symbiodinium sp. CCMP2456]